MRFLIVLCSIGSAVLVAVNTMTAIAEENFALVPDLSSFDESLDHSVQVSGQLLGGLMYRDSKEKKVDIGRLKVDFTSLEGKSGDVVCFRVASRDGVYTAKWTTSLDAAINSKTSVTFDTRHKGYLENLSTDELVVIASISELCGSSSARYLPTQWAQTDQENSPPEYLTAFLNTDASAVFVALTPRKKQEKQALIKKTCSLLADSVDKTNFDTVCDIPIRDLGDHSLHSLSIVAQYGSSYRPAEIFELSSPD